MFKKEISREELGSLYSEDIPEEDGYYYVAEQMYGGLYYEKIMLCKCWQKAVVIARQKVYSRWTSYKQSISGTSMSRMWNKKRRFLVGPKVKSLMELV